jgi:uncharacterized membrane protein YbaN (DUF454 family)
VVVLKKWFRIGVGVVLVFLGILGSLLPIIPGFVFLIPGLVILAEYFPPVRRVLNWAKQKAGMKPDPVPEGDGAAKQNP